MREKKGRRGGGGGGVAYGEKLIETLTGQEARTKSEKRG